MTPDLLDLARALTAMLDWASLPWVRMTSVDSVPRAATVPNFTAGLIVIDLMDAGNGGVLLNMLGPGWVARHSRSGWGVLQYTSSLPVERVGAAEGPSLAAACARAMVARGRA